jgi:hypothetical protein
MRTQESDASWVLRHTIAFLGVVVVVVLVIIGGFQAVIPPFWIWLILLVLFNILTLIISRAFTRRWLGILIDDRNKYSLSRFQMVLWTLIILSAFMAAVLANIQLKLLVYVSGAVDRQQIVFEPAGALVSDVLWHAGVLVLDEQTGTFTAAPGVDLSQINLAEPLKDGQQVYVPRPGETVTAQTVSREADENALTPTTPLSVQIPSEVWILLGISTTSLVAAPLIKSQKSETIVKNQSVSEARISDLFQGEEVNNFNLLDLGKVQLIYFTLIVIGAYMIAVASLFLRTQNAISALPALDGGVVAMLGVSHAGYLGNKAVNRGGNDMAIQAQAASPNKAAAPPPPLPHDDDQQTGAG